MKPLTEHKDKVFFFFLYAAAYGLTSFILLALLNIKRLFLLLEGASDVRTDSLSGYFGSAIGDLAHLLDKIPHSRTIFTFIFWLFVGLIVYFCTIFISMSVYNIARDENLLLHYKAPFGNTKSSILRRVLLHWTLTLLLALMVLLLLGILLGLLLPVTRQLFMSGWYSPMELSQWLYTWEAVIMLALGMAATMFASRLWWRVFRS